MTNIKLLIENETKLTDPVDKLLKHLFADKRSVYVDDIHINGDIFEVSYCLDHTLHIGKPQWMDVAINQEQLIDFIKDERLNYWESFRYDAQSGSVQPFANVVHDLDTFLTENYRDIIKEYMDAGLHLQTNRS